MRVTQSGGRGGDSGRIMETVRDLSAKAFSIAAVATILVAGYLIYGLLTGRLAETSAMSHADRAHLIELVTNISNLLTICTLVTVVTGAVSFWDVDVLAYGFLGAAVFLAYGLQYCIAYLSQSGTAILQGAAAQLTLGEMHTMALALGVPGLILTVFHLAARIWDGIAHRDLSHVEYGRNATREANRSAAIGALANCWQLAFCREGIRKNCPIFHARTKCWKQRVGCMCEENIILLSMGGGTQTPKSLENQTTATATGFVPIGDLITGSTEEARKNIPTRVGPRGIRIPVNPHITPAQARNRCNNCIIYNEHQRQKYQLLSAPVTLIVPLLVYFQFDHLRLMVEWAMQQLDNLIGHVSFSAGVDPQIGEKFGSLPIETIIIVCLSLVLMTWAHRLLEYCMFKIKI
ncbi:MAG: hypothetical protein KGJ62_07305 [Armatimonadetes bacterium]|nr:hypothetical protein [Armatimonadota bacterium]MDE2206946.1 hypothetical protein [Armatimonadota bacterium]